MEADRPSHGDPRATHRALQTADGARAGLAPGGDGHRTGAALPGQARDRRRHHRSRPARAHDHRRPLHLHRHAEPRDERCADVLHRLDGRAHSRRPAQHALPPPAAALARLLRAQPRGRDHQPADERRRGARPARDRRRDDARPEHALPDRHVGHPLPPRLAPRAGHAHGAAVHVPGDRVLPDLLRAGVSRSPRAARPRDGHARRGHQRHARRPGVPPRAREREELPCRERPLPRGEPADGPAQRPLLPGRGLPLGGGDRDRARLRRPPRLQRRPHRRNALRVRPLPVELLRPRAAALAALQHVPVGCRRSGQHHERHGRGARGARQGRRDGARPHRGRRRLRKRALRLRGRAGGAARDRPRGARRARPSRSSATPARASRRSRSSWRASTIRARGDSRSTASTSAT